ncbi:hypothetical protein MNB_SM-3-1424 [hydrothermal vent metagenome]|uniref:Uncharacterized protein n=1 Tax=hydrothermal vent metagenome TaxID=652676 RepID=A0A1W1D257_9ZZZZ
MIHDIKPLLEIKDYSFYYLLVIVIVFSFLFGSGVYLFIKWLKKEKKRNIKEEHLEILNHLDLEDTKKTAYAISKYGATFKDDSNRHLEMYNNLIARLQRYKYKKDVESFDEETLGYIEVYRGMCDV